MRTGLFGWIRDLGKKSWKKVNTFTLSFLKFDFEKPIRITNQTRDFSYIFINIYIYIYIIYNII